jgi:ethanolamine ammonia-lyase small subunit
MSENVDKPQRPVPSDDAWRPLRARTPARIALGRAGASLPTAAHLEFQLAHARARDAVHRSFDARDLLARLERAGCPAMLVRSQVSDRRAYLERPDLGRRVHPDDLRLLADRLDSAQPSDVVIIASDGLSALAAERQIVPLVAALAPRLVERGLGMAPVVVAPLARVAIEDEIGAELGARAALILLGERPGLGSPDSLGAYLVFTPRMGRTDAERNCVSNIRPEGLPPERAAEKLAWLVCESLRRGLSGVALKDGSDAVLPTREPPPRLGRDA